MAQAEWDGAHAVYARGPEARSYSQPKRPAQAGGGQYGQPPQYHVAPEAGHEAGPSGGYGAGHGPAAARGHALGRAMGLAGALVSVALIAGLGVWGYKLALRDVTGVPVVRALEGPMRMRPEDPGGLAVAHQGLAVNAVAAVGVAEGPAEQVTLAPAPIDLTEEDVPARPGAEISATLAAEDAEMLPVPLADPAAPVMAAADPAAETALAPAASLSDAADDAVAQALAMADALAAAAEPLSGDQADLTLRPEATALLAAAIVAVDVPGVALSPRPQPRPDGLVARAAMSPAEMVPMSPGVREVPASEIAVGTRLVQLGAFESEEVARAEWDKIALRFEDIVEGKDRVIEMAQSGGKTFYRLRAMGFEDLSDARRFCAALMAGQAACIPVVTR